MIYDVHLGHDLVNLKDVDLPFLSQHEHSLSCKGSLLYLRLAWYFLTQLDQSLTIFLIYFYDLH